MASFCWSGHTQERGEGSGVVGAVAFQLDRPARRRIDERDAAAVAQLQRDGLGHGDFGQAALPFQNADNAGNEPIDQIRLRFSSGLVYQSYFYGN